MYRMPAQFAARVAIFVGVRTLTATALTEQFDMEDDTVALPAAVSGVAAQHVVGRYTDGLIDRVADKIQARRAETVTE